MPNYLKLTLNYLHVLTKYNPYLHATLYFKTIYCFRFCFHQAWITKTNFNDFSLREFIAPLKFSLEQIKHLFFLKNAFNFYKKGFFCAFF
ncbi:hypothetical protein F7195_00810 [Helicobacter pylori]|nr:hypothetical protein [Helicobacter pylori]